MPCNVCWGSTGLSTYHLGLIHLGLSFDAPLLPVKKPRWLTHWPSDVTPYGDIGSTLTQIVASRDVNLCWLIIKHVLWHSPESNSTSSAYEFNPWYAFGITHSNLLPHPTGANGLINDGYITYIHYHRNSYIQNKTNPIKIGNLPGTALLSGFQINWIRQCFSKCSFINCKHPKWL